MAATAVHAFCGGGNAENRRCLPDISRNPNYFAKPRNISSLAPTSLPPLPNFYYPPQERHRWGEDDVIERQGFHVTTSGYARFRHNVDSCHPVPDVVAAKFEGFMYPKPMQQDISVLHNPRTSTSRNVPRDSKYQLFPANDPGRTAFSGGGLTLGDSTRCALADYTKQLYGTSSNDIMYKDTSDFIIRKLDRDHQYRKECEDADETPTCCRILNHPDPCHHCWAGGLNMDFDAKLTHFQSQLHDEIKRDPGLCNGEELEKCELCQNTSCPHKHHCLKPIVPQNTTNESNIADATVHNSTNETRDICTSDAHVSHCNQPEEIDAHVNNSLAGRRRSAKKVHFEHEEYDLQAQQELPDTELHSDLFGPWSDSFKLSEHDETLLLPYVYNFKLPSSMHCWPTENDHASPCKDRHSPLIPYDGTTAGYFGPWAALCRTKQVSTNLLDPTLSPSILRQRAEYMSALPTGPMNSWTLRDQNNLRVPCIPNVIGNKHKSDAHKRFHQDHPESIPDLRDFRKYSRRVNFFGYNSSVFR